MKEFARRFLRSWVADWKRGWFPVAVLVALALPVPVLFIAFVFGIPWVLWLYWREFQQWRNSNRKP